MYTWHTFRLLNLRGSCTGSHWESSGRSYTILLNSEGSCIRILAHSQAIFIVLCLLIVLHSDVPVASHSTAARVLLGPWCLICDSLVVTHCHPNRPTRTTSRVGHLLGRTLGMRRTGIHLTGQQTSSSSTSSVMMATSTATWHYKWRTM